MAELSPDVDELQGRRAGLVTRGVGFAIDFGCVLAGLPMIMWGWAIVIGLLTFSTPEYPDLPRAVSALVALVWNFSYFVLGWYLTGRTVGMAVMGVRVVGRSRDRLGIVQVVVRHIVLFATLLVAPLWLFFARSRLAIHDRAARTQVIYDRRESRSTVSVDVGTVGSGPSR